jgi:GNAT superfamily N-acetyltransferase
MITYSDQISVEEYNALRNSVGWKEIKPERAKRGINNSVCFVAAEGEKPVGLARLISDGGYVSAIFDVIVNPDYQKQGIGTELMKRVMRYIADDLGENENQMICLLAAKGKEDFYKRFGFEERPNDNTGAGMSQWVKKGVNI